MKSRPWRIEYMNAEGAWVPLDKRRYHWKFRAERAMNLKQADQPGVLMRVRKHVDFEAAS